jgi:hypothetical protein
MSLFKKLSLAALAATALTGLVATPSHAAAGNVVVQADAVVYTGTSGSNQIRVVRGSGDTIILLEQNPDASASITAGAGCTQNNTRNVSCPAKSQLALHLGAGDDTFRVGIPGTAAFGISTTVVGEAGKDTYFGGTDAGISQVTFFGGLDRDMVTYGESPSRVLVRLDNVALDGRMPGGFVTDKDDIRKDVEDISGSEFADVLEGNEFDNSIFGGRGADVMRGFAGADHLNAHDFASGDANKDTLIDCGVGGTGTDRADVDKNDPSTKECAVVIRN